MTEIANSLQVIERNGGDDGTRTRGLCRDRAAKSCNYLKLDGVGRHSLEQQATLRYCYRPLNVPRFRLGRNFEGNMRCHIYPAKPLSLRQVKVTQSEEGEFCHPSIGTGMSLTRK
jgi:hypothetical protein